MESGVSADPQLAAFQVPLAVHWFSSCVERFAPWWIRLGHLETMAMGERLHEHPIDRPIYVAGIARAGTTILLELLAQHEQVATHRYSDFPGQFVPYWWNRHRRPPSSAPRERAHADRLHVTEQSPEAMEETLWMAFFPHLHDPQVENVLAADTHSPQFAAFYCDHVQKLLMVRQRERYVAKGNYNLTRFPYLHTLFPDARFVAVVRNPRDQIASLIKQHRLFSAGEQAYPRALAHLQRVGHFEFGLDRRPINVGDGRAAEVAELWRTGEEVRGTARYWASVYGWFADGLESGSAWTDSTRVLRYEDLCGDPAATLALLAEHCELPDSDAMRKFTSGISAPNYYEPDFTAEDESAIAEETAEVAARFGYGVP